MSQINDNYNEFERRFIKLRRKFCGTFQNFRRYYFKHYHKSEDAPFHRELVEMLQKVSAQRSSKIALAAPRGSAKSTIITMEYVIYLICYHLEDFIILVSSTSDHAGTACSSTSLSASLPA